MFSDGSASSSSESSLTQGQKEASVGIVFTTTYDFATGNNTDGDGMLMVGIYNSHDSTSSTPEEWLNWCSTSSGGYTHLFYTNDNDGSSNWQIIKNGDNANAGVITGTYPAFEWAENYGSKYGLSGSYASDWYIPSINELIALNDSIDLVNTVFDNVWIGDLTRDIYGIANTMNSSYFSSSQEKNSTIDDYDKKACTFSFYTENIACGYKDKGDVLLESGGNPQYVLVVRKVN